MRTFPCRRRRLCVCPWRRRTRSWMQPWTRSDGEIRTHFRVAPPVLRPAHERRGRAYRVGRRRLVPLHVPVLVRKGPPGAAHGARGRQRPGTRMHTHIHGAHSHTDVHMNVQMHVNTQPHTREYIRARECGFNPFEDARNKFDVRFYVVAILFIIFDLEVIFLCPWSLVLRRIDSLGF